MRYTYRNTVTGYISLFSFPNEESVKNYADIVIGPDLYHVHPTTDFPQCPFYEAENQPPNSTVRRAIDEVKA